jgi:hypothetical protein
MYFGIDKTHGKDITVYHGKFGQPLIENLVFKDRIVQKIIGDKNKNLRIDNVERFEDHLEISFSTCDPDLIKKIKSQERISCTLEGV